MGSREMEGAELIKQASKDMEEIKYLKKLDAYQERELLIKMKFPVYPGFIIGSQSHWGTEKRVGEKLIRYQSWYNNGFKTENHNYLLSDFAVINSKDDDENTKILRKYLYSIFGEEYKKDLKAHLNKRTHRMIENAKKQAEKVEKEIDGELESL